MLKKLDHFDLFLILLYTVPVLIFIEKKKIKLSFNQEVEFCIMKREKLDFF